MIRVHQLIASGLGIGYIGKGAGTVAAVVTAACWYLLQAGASASFTLQWAITLLIIFAGTWSAGQVQARWGKDPQQVVIDEVAGMCISLLMLPPTLAYVFAGLLLFRIFDIVKPLYIKEAERLPNGWGVMADDVLAGIYANLLLQVARSLKLF